MGTRPTRPGKRKRPSRASRASTKRARAKASPAPAKAARAAAPRPDPTSLAELIADPENRRRHGDRNLAMMTAALQHVGAARSIVIDEQNVVLAGNGIASAAPGAGISRVRVIDAAGDELIAVRRRGLSADDKRALALYDNRTAELAEWSAEQLRADVGLGLDLAPWFSAEELEQATSAFAVAGAEAPTLASGDRSPIQQMTFTLHDDQAETVRQALAQARGRGGGEGDGTNENGNGNALAYVCAAFLQHG